jgi:hypothetical protein
MRCGDEQNGGKVVNEHHNIVLVTSSQKAVRETSVDLRTRKRDGKLGRDERDRRKRTQMASWTT